MVCILQHLEDVCLLQVISDKANKTILVAVDRWMIVPKYKKKIKRTSKFMAHDENNDCRMGDIVRIHISRLDIDLEGAQSYCYLTEGQF